jgi:uncharacterized membrane protein
MVLATLFLVLLAAPGAAALPVFHERVGQAYWDELVESVLAHFRGERFRDGLVHAVGEVGAVLRQHFPRRPDDVNELPDRVSVEPS